MFHESILVANMYVQICPKKKNYIFWVCYYFEAYFVGIFCTQVFDEGNQLSAITEKLLTIDSKEASYKG